MRKTTADFIKDAKLIHSDSYDYSLVNYSNCSTKVSIKHVLCGLYFIQSPDKHLCGRGCPSCFGKKKFTNSILQEKSNVLYNNEYTIVGDYINSQTKIDIKHNVCGSIYKQTPNNHIQGKRCFFCYGSSLKTKEILQKESNIIHKNNYIITGDYIGTRKKIKIKHIVCNSEFYQEPYSHLSGNGCPNCKLSKGEVKIQDILTNKNIKYIKQKSFDGCNYRILLRFDFYLPEHNICIEYDGIQHSKPIEWFGGQKAFDEQNDKDKVKNEYCLANNIRLIRISYLDLNNIADILEKIEIVNEKV